MPLVNSKANVLKIIRAHRATYVDAATGRPSLRDRAEFEWLPILAAILLAVFDVTLSPSASVGLLTISGLLGAFLFGVMLQISDRAMNWADDPPPQGRDTSDHAIYLEQLAANAGYASLVSLAAAIAYVVAATADGHPWVLRIASAVGLALGLHLLLTLLMVMKRVFALTQQRLNRARTGVTRGIRRDKDRAA